MPDGGAGGETAGDGLSARRVLDFNLAPLPHTDDTWFDVWPQGGTMRALSTRAESRPWLARWILSEAGVGEALWTDFMRPRARLALLQRERLQLVLLYVGLVLRHDELRMEIDGAVLQRIRASVGARPMEFALRAAPLLPPAGVFERRETLSEPRLRFIELGAAYALDPVAAREHAYHSRLALRLPAPVAHALEKAPPDRDPGDGALPPLVRRIMTEIANPWLPLFA